MDSICAPGSIYPHMLMISEYIKVIVQRVKKRLNNIITLPLLDTITSPIFTKCYILQKYGFLKTFCVVVELDRIRQGYAISLKFLEIKT